MYAKTRMLSIVTVVLWDGLNEPSVPPFLLVFLVPRNEFVRSVEQRIISSHKFYKPLSLYILYVNAVEVHGNQRNGVRWLYEPGTI